MSSNVLAGIDGSEHTAAVCDYAAWAADRLSASLVLLHVLHRPEPIVLVNLSAATSLDAQEQVIDELAALDEKRLELVRERSRLILEQATARIEAAGYPAPRAVQREGRLVQALARYDDYAELLVLGRQGSGHAGCDHRLGSHVEQVIRTTDRPLLLTLGSFQPPRRLMLAFDGSATSEKGVAWLAGSPLFAGLECHLVMVGEDEPGRRASLARAARTLTDAGRACTTALLQGKVESCLLDYQRQQDIDLMLMSAYSQSRLREWLLGSTTHHMLAQTGVPLLILR